MCGHSHQLFHFCVLIACCVHYFENLTIYHRRQEFHCPINAQR
jgi:predicted membrane channel-forming protein YqfA (hemolysin III family)